MMKQLTNEQLVSRIQSGENTAENMLQLWQQTKAYIYKVAKRYSGYAEIDDLVQEGYFGLNLAVEHYKDQGRKFITYLTFWLKQTMQRYIENNRSVRLPSEVCHCVIKYNKFIRQYEQEHGCEPSDDVCMEFFDIDAETLDKLKKNANKANISSLDAVISKDDDSLTLGDSIASEQDLEEAVIRARDHELMSKALWGAIGELSEKQLFVMKRRYQDRDTCEKLGRELGCSFQYIRSLERQTIRKLKQPHLIRRYKDYYEHYLTPYPIIHIGVDSFQRTGYSEVERAVLGW